jgi:hypothetical protein
MLMLTNVSLAGQLFKLMVDKKYKIRHMFDMGSLLQINLGWFDVLKFAHTLNYLTDQLDQLVTVQCVAINTHGQRFMTRHKYMMDHGPIAICHSSGKTWLEVLIMKTQN